MTEASEGGRIRGVLFCNELLDAMPVHRIGWDPDLGQWFEWGVELSGGRFCWTRLSQPATARPKWEDAIPVFPPEFLAALPDGFTFEVCPRGIEWQRQAAHALTAGRLVVMDYGYTFGELLASWNREGTLRAYSRHLSRHDVLAAPGDQDITADIDFTALQAAGEAAGLTTEALVSQETFLTRIAQAVWTAPCSSSLWKWTKAQTRQFQTLTHPDHLGRAFRVLVQRARG
jgi:SAM-dependent MidA family methyltransferase